MRVHRARWSPYRYTRRRWHVLAAVVDAVGWLTLGPFKALARVASLLFGRRGLRNDVQSILVVQLDHLGDAILSLGLLRLLRQQYPSARLHVLTSPWNDELFADGGRADHVHVLAPSRFARDGRRWWPELIRCGWRLRLHRFDLAIDVRGELPHALLMWLTGARRRVGWACGGGGFLLTDRVPYVSGRHELESRAALARAVGIDVAANNLSSIAPRIQPTAAALRFADEQIANAWPPRLRENAGPLVAIHVGAGTPAKRWRAEAWQATANLLARDCRARIVIVGSQHDAAAAEIVANGDPTALRRLNVAGRMTLSKLAGVLQRVDLFIGTDSGPAHLAAAVGTPTLVLFSGTNDPDQWRPWLSSVVRFNPPPACSPCHREACPFANHPCLTGLTPEEITRRAIEKLTSTFGRRLRRVDEGIDQSGNGKGPNLFSATAPTKRE